jgi:CheY-like chemotaxis protein
MTDRPPSPLANAHARFRDGLARRGRELLELAERASRGERAVDEELGRRVHALYASAEVFQDDELTRASRDVARLLDLAREEKRTLSKLELSAVMSLAEQLDAALLGRGGSQDKPPRPIALHQTLSGQVSAPDVIAVMLIGGHEVEASLRAALPAERCELTTSSDLAMALEVIDQVAPDIVLVDAAVLGHDDPTPAMAKLRGERNSVTRAVALIVPQGAQTEALLARTRADAVLKLPLASGVLLERLHRFALGEPTRKLAIETLTGGTIEQIAQGVAEQVRRGIVDAVRTGKNEQIELGDQAELLAATWSAVSRIRAHLADLTDGRVRFDPRPRGEPAALALTASEAADSYVGLEEPLHGRRILVADDDPAVVWFFAGLLREAGAIVIEANDGQVALELARRKPPDLVVSDILMPGVDGFALCRELRRDLALSHVPVILISWKEDFLQRMRELDAGAAGYLRKEAGSHQILATVAQVLTPRSELDRLLTASDEVRGRIDALGAERLLHTVAHKRPDARIAIRDAFNLFEVDVRGGAQLAVTRTAADGTFARGALALRQLVGVTSGRYTVTRAEGALRGAFNEPLDKALGDAIREVGSLLDAVSDSFLLRVERVRLDDDVLSALLAVTPTELAEVAARLRSAEPVSRLILSGRWSARELEEHLRELVRRGAITAVYGPSGEELSLEARAARERDPGSLLHASSAVRRSTMAPPTMLSERDVDWVEETGDGSAPVVHEVGPYAIDDNRNALERQVDDELDAILSQPPAGTSASNAVSTLVEGNARDRDPIAEAGGIGAVRFMWLLMALMAIGYASWSAIRTSRTAVPPPPPETMAPPTSAEGPAEGAPVAPVPAEEDAPAAQAPAPAAPAAPPAAPAAPAAPPAVPAAPAPTATQDTVEFGRVLPSIDSSRGVAVAKGQGLLVVEPGPKLAKKDRPHVKIAGQDRGIVPVAIALHPGRHELVLLRGSATSFRYLVIRPGETRIVTVD